MIHALLLPFRFAARHGRACLVLGLLAGLFLPGLAQALRLWLPELVAGLIFVAAFRIGPRAALGSLSDLPGVVRTVALYQLALPLAALGLFAALGIAATPAALALTLMLAAPSVTGAPNFTILTGHDPAPALRLLILGTAVFPLTSIPVLWLLPGLGEVSVMATAGRLMVIIALATGLAFLLRAPFPELAPDRRAAADGLSAILLAVVVVGLMSGLGPALRADPGLVFRWLAVAMVANLGLQLAAFALFRGRADAVPRAIVAGNRNVALFLIALPDETTRALLIFIGCYQVPMYLTPILMGRLYRRAPEG